MKKKYFFPIVLVWRDKTIYVKGADILYIMGLYIRKGRTLTINGVDPLKRFEMRVSGPMKVHGDIRLAKTAQEVSVEELRKLSENNEAKS